MKTVTWREGSYVFFRAIMDTHLIKYLQPFFVEETQFWFQKLRRKPVPPLMTSFVDGLVVNEVTPNSTRHAASLKMKDQQEKVYLLLSSLPDGDAVTFYEINYSIVMHRILLDHKLWDVCTHRSRHRPLQSCVSSKLIAKRA